MTSTANLPLPVHEPSPPRTRAVVTEAVSRTVPSVIGVKDNQDGTWTAFVREKDESTGSWKKRQKTFRSFRSAQAWRERQVGRKDGSEAFRQSNIRERRGKWCVEIDKTDPTGVRYRRSKTFETLEEAEAWREAVHAALEKGLAVPEPDTPASAPKLQEKDPEVVAEAVERWFELNYLKRQANGTLLPDTVAAIRRDINAFVVPNIGTVRLDELSPEQVEATVSNMAEAGYARSRQNRFLYIVNRTYGLAGARGWARTNPAYGIKSHRPAKVSTYRVKTKPKDALPANRNSDGSVKSFHDVSPQLLRQMSANLPLPTAVAVWLGYLCGLRAGEALGLRMCDVDLDRRLMFITGQGGRAYSDFDENGQPITRTRVERTKGPIIKAQHASRRLLYIPNCLVGYLQTIYDQRTAAGAGEEDPFFVGRSGAGLSAHSLSSALKRVSREVMPAGTHLRPHDLRKNAATNLTAADVKPFDLSVWMGHDVGAYDGQAAVTAAVYIKSIPSDDLRHIQRLRAVADLVDRIAGTDPLVPVEVEDAEWVTVAEAAEEMGTDRKAVLALARQGQLVAQQRYWARHRRALVWHVSRASMQTYLESRGVGLSAVAAKYGVRPDVLKDIAAQAGVELLDNRAGQGSGRDFFQFTPEAVAVLDEVMGKRQAFLATHIDKKTVMETTGLSRHRVDSLVRAGVFVPVQPEFPDAHLGLGTGVAVWFSKAAVKKAMPRVRKAMR